MQTTNYAKINNSLGWIVWLIATITYAMTVAPTTSFWDCGEYIATSVKLQVGHPPGAPLFQMLGSFFGLFAMGDLTMQAYMVNMMSALSSSFTILFLFWTITYMARKLALREGGVIDRTRMIAIFGSGLVGALAFTWSDTFWYSAVEAEVYAMSSLFTAAAIWAVTRWERVADNDAYANRWLVMIAYILGLAVGVHFLVFLTIPAICMVVYYKRNPDATLRQAIIATAVSIGILGFTFAVLIPVLLKIFGWMEMGFVNTIDLPKNSGTIFTLLLLIALTVFGIKWAHKKKKPLLSQGIMAVVFLMIGYSSFVMLSIRSNANTPIDENNPEDALSLLAYYNREQYGDHPVLYGATFNAKLDNNKPFRDGTPTYYFDEEQEEYLVANPNKNAVPNYDKDWKVFFPRMWSDQPDHVSNYMALSDLRNKEQKPEFKDNFKFFINYQIGHMYWRYFLWNFVGRQNDQQHKYEITKGNWLSGIGFVDEGRLGPQTGLPDNVKNDPARNTYFALPFLLGLLGLGYQAWKDRKDAWVVTLFFLFTGLAVVAYTNLKPFEPRERDYAFVGSFYAFAIWIGLGVWAIFNLIKKQMQTAPIATGITAVLLLIVPGRMLAENWDDHDRSERYTARDVAKAYLDSCDPNAILFTNGDNDTFPLWYIQEVEEYRTDVRVVNLSLLNTDWYIDQLKRKAYNGEPVPFSFDWQQYKMGTRDVIYHSPEQFRANYSRAPGSRWLAEDFIKWTKNDGQEFMVTAYPNTTPRHFHYYPQNKLRLPIDAEAVIRNGVVDVKDSARIVSHIDWNLEGSALLKRDLMVIDLIAHNNWERPIYFAITVGSSPKSFFWLQNYFRLEGLTYRFVPIKTETEGRNMEYGMIDADRLYNKVMSWDFGNMGDPDVYMDETNRRTTYNLRTVYGRLANALASEGQKEKAIEVLDEAMRLMPPEKYEYNYFLFGMIEAYYTAGAPDKARTIIDGYADQLDQQLDYYSSFSTGKRRMVSDEIQSSLQLYQMLVNMVQQTEIGGARSQEDMQQNDLYQRYRAKAGLFGRS